MLGVAGTSNFIICQKTTNPRKGIETASIFSTFVFAASAEVSNCQKTTNPRKGIETCTLCQPSRLLLQFVESENNESPQGD